MKKLIKNLFLYTIFFYVVTISFLTPYLIGLIESFKPVKAASIVEKYELKGDDPLAYGLAFEAVTFKGIDGNKLTGWFIKSDIPSTRCVFLVHGWKSSGVATLEYLDILKEYKINENHNIFIIHLRNSGDSEKMPSDLGYRTSRDVFSGIKFLNSEKNITEIKFLSISMGAMATTLALTSYQKNINDLGINISKVFLDSPLSNVFSSIRSEDNAIAQSLGELVYGPVLFFLNLRWNNMLHKLRLAHTLKNLDFDKLMIVQGEKDALTKLSALLEEIQGFEVRTKIFEQGAHARLYQNNTNQYKKIFADFILE